jgi:hypothetical protein
MKKLFLILTLFFSIGVISCSKSAQELQAPSKVDQLFTQLKNEPKFLEYLNSVNNTMKILEQNILKTQPEDSTILKNKSLSFNEKYKQLNFTGEDDLKNSNKISNELMTYLLGKYPLFKSLTDEESKLLYRKAYSHYFKTKIK